MGLLKQLFKLCPVSNELKMISINRNRTRQATNEAPCQKLRNIPLMKGGQLPVIPNGHPEGEGTEAGHSRVGQIIHHPVNVLLQ